MNTTTNSIEKFISTIKFNKFGNVDNVDELQLTFNLMSEENLSIVISELEALLASIDESFLYMPMRFSQQHFDGIISQYETTAKEDELSKLLN